MLNGDQTADVPLGELSQSPTISVVIPSRGRPALLERAIRSVLLQTYRYFEILVVLDGPDAESAARVDQFQDCRIRLLTLPNQSGGCAARNAGVTAAKCRWIAFLDDDDEFAPQKLEFQLESALHSASPDHTLTVCRSKVVEHHTTKIWPARFPASTEHIADYLFCRKSLCQGGTFLQSSTYFMSRNLALHVPFREGLNRHQDWDWVIRLQREANATITGVSGVLALYHRDDGLSASRLGKWEPSLDWAREVVLTTSPRAFSFFVATQCVTRLDQQQCWSRSVLRRLYAECFRHGHANLHCAFLFASFWARALYKSLLARSRHLLTEYRAPI